MVESIWEVDIGNHPSVLSDMVKRTNPFTTPCVAFVYYSGNKATPQHQGHLVENVSDGYQEIPLTDLGPIV